MPGIVGIIGRIPPARAARELRQMIDALRHESFYVTGMCVDEPLEAYVGWIARKDSFSDRMPLRNERKDVELVFSGEEYPDPGTIQGLKERGHNLEDTGPSYLVHLYEDDPSFPVGLNGRFHGLLMDRNRGTALLFNDRYGMHRIYYHESKEAFYFAGEAKAILAVRPECRRLDPRGFGEFVACSSVLENRTLFGGIQVLPPASKWVFRNGSLERKSSYFHPQEWEDQEKLDPETYYSELRRVFIRNLPRYFDGQERVAMSLTGGLDTRMILASRRFQPGSLPSYTFGSMFNENRDVRVARQVAKVCDQPHQVITAGKEFLSGFPHYAERAVYLTDGCVDVGRAPDLYLNEKARKIAPVRMTGNYGGEILRCVRAFKPEVSSRGLFHPDVLRWANLGSETYASIAAGHPVSFAVFKQAPWHHYGILSLEQTQLSMRSPYLDNDFVRTVFRSPESALKDNTVCLRLIADGNEALLRIPTDRGLAGDRGRFLRAASRSFLQLQFKAEYAYDMGMPQWLSRIDHALAGLHLENLFLGRHKVFHFRVWYRDALRGYVQEMLLDPRSLSRPYIDRKGCAALVQGHLQGNRNHTNAIHKMLALELVHRLFLDQTRAEVPKTVDAESLSREPRSGACA
jgi:asparagine synthase (glutamine-hydrolysing)